MINSFKSLDPRYEMYCTSFSPIQNTPNMLNDLICNLGNVIDEKHMRWLEQLQQLESDLQDDIQEAISAIYEIYTLLGKVCCDLSLSLSLSLYICFPYIF